MRLLTLNCGSSTLKFDIFEVDGADRQSFSRLATGIVEAIGGEALASLIAGGQTTTRAGVARNHVEALALALDLLSDKGMIDGIGAVGHRVVHGGASFRFPVLIDQVVIDAIETAGELAPLHNRPALAVIRAARERFGDNVPTVATFDTAFFTSLPDVASLYALPREMSERLGIRRFGFHGLAHRYMVERYRALRPDVKRPRLVTFQLGSGCSVTASADGQALDTSMGFTPLEGLIMGTRSGDLDPSIPLFLMEKEGLSSREVDSLLNTESGLLGLSGKSQDVRELLVAAEAGDAAADLAVKAFCYRATKYLGAYLAVLGGADAVIFGGGIGEHCPEIRQTICAGSAWAGLEIDLQRNKAAPGSDWLISTDAAKIDAWVFHVDEATVIARDVMDCPTG